MICLKNYGIYTQTKTVKSCRKTFYGFSKTGDDFNNIYKAINNYLGTDKVLRGFIKNGSTFSTIGRTG